MIRALGFAVSPASGVPIYRQVIDQVRTRIAGGGLKPGDTLPSVRQLAAHLQVNHMTISKAYSRLENEGLLTRVPGRPMRVADMPHAATVRQRQAQLKGAARELAVKARQLALTPEQAIFVVQSLLEDLTDERTGSTTSRSASKLQAKARTQGR